MKNVAVLTAIVALVHSHATFQQLWKNGEDLESTCARLPRSNSPIEDYTGTALQCNVNPAAASGKCSFEAGDTVTIEMHQHNDRLCTKEGIGGVHWGPVLAYLGKVEDAATADGSGEFFKVYQNAWKKNTAASQGNNDFWGTKDINYNCGKLDFKIPSDIAPGDYLLRAEAIALHAASTSGGAQHYVTCYQLTVTGSGSLVPKGVTFPEAYSKTGPGLGFSIYANLADYPVPGPALIAGGTEATPQLLTFGEISSAPPVAPSVTSVPAAASSIKTSVIVASSQAYIPSSAVAEAKPIVASTSSIASNIILTEAPSGAATPTASATPLVSSSLTPAIISDLYSAAPGPIVPTTLATSVRSKPTHPATGSIKEYYRCGGRGFKGASTCAKGLVCKEWNPWYSQCVRPDATKPGPSKGPVPTPDASKPATPSQAATAPAEPQPTEIEPSENGSEPSENTYTLETFIAFLQREAGSESAAKIRRMIEALQF